MTTLALGALHTSMARITGPPGPAGRRGNLAAAGAAGAVPAWQGSWGRCFKLITALGQPGAESHIPGWLAVGRPQAASRPHGRAAGTVCHQCRTCVREQVHMSLRALMRVHSWQS